MTEALLAWGLLIAGIVCNEPLAFIASGAFATAAQISRIVDRMDDKND